MKSPDGATESIWLDHVKVPKYRGLPAAQSVDVDVCVVGAGIAGLTTAYYAVMEGLSVVVLDEGPIGGGQTGRTSAHLASAIDDRFIEMERLHGVEGSRLAYESHAKAIDAIERISREERIDCDFARLNAYLTALPEDPPDLLDKEFAAAGRAGFATVQKLPSGGLNGAPCLQFGNQARFHPMRYLIGLAEALKRKGGRICTGRRVMDVQGSDAKTQSPARIKLQGLRKAISARHVIVATNTPSPVNDWFAIYTKQSSYRSYMIGVQIPRQTIEDALYWDTGDPYHYVRLEHVKGEQNDILLVGGEDHKTGQFPANGAPFMKLEEWARKQFPVLGEVTHRWSGQVQEPADGLAFIGRAVTDKAEIYVCTGDSGMGLTHGTIAAQLITDQIMGRPNPYEKLYNPARDILNKEFIKENVNTVAQYVDLVTPGEVKSAEDVLPGDGAVLREGLTKVAVYRDESGKIHKHSAICTHLQCVVNWNHIERSWDCPCHGSRFDAMGKVLIGPAVTDLPKAT